MGGHLDVAELASVQHGLVSRAQAVELGLSGRQIRYRVESGLWGRVHAGVFRVRGAPQVREQALLAACLAIGPETAVSHRAAAVTFGLLNYRKAPIEVTTTRRRSPEVEGVTVHRLADLQARWVTNVDFVPVTTVARTLVDLGSVTHPRTVEAALDRALGRRITAARDVRDALVAVARKGRHGVGVLRPMIDVRLQGDAPAGVSEARMSTLLRDAGLAHAVAEHTVVDEHGGFIAVVDFAFPDRRLAVEVDGYEFHSSPKAVAHRNVRDRQLLDAEWRPLHFTWTEVDRDPSGVGSEIRRQLRARPVFSARWPTTVVGQRAEKPETFLRPR
jgi:hypothetical protein